MTTRPSIATRIASPLLIGMLTVTACGSDDIAENTPTAETTAFDTAAPDTSNTSETATPETEVAATGDASTYAEFCTTLSAYIQSPSDPDEADDPADLEPVVRAAPPEIADDMQNLLDMFVQISAFDEMTASADEIAEFEAVLEEFDPLAAEMEAWWTANCPGFALD